MASTLGSQVPAVTKKVMIFGSIVWVGAKVVGLEEDGNAEGV